MSKKIKVINLVEDHGAQPVFTEAALPGACLDMLSAKDTDGERVKADGQGNVKLAEKVRAETDESEEKGQENPFDDLARSARKERELEQEDKGGS